MDTDRDTEIERKRDKEIDREIKRKREEQIDVEMRQNIFLHQHGRTVPARLHPRVETSSDERVGGREHSPLVAF